MNKKILTIIMTFILILNGTVLAYAEMPVTTGDFQIIENEIIINVTEDFDGTLNEALKELGIVSIELIFNVEGTVMYLVKTEAPVEGIIESLEALTYVNYAEYDQAGNFLASDMETSAGIIENEIIINVTEEFDGTLNEALKNLGIVSIELIFDVEGTVMYLVKTEAPVEGIIESLDALSYVNYAEYNQIAEVFTTDMEMGIGVIDSNIIENEIIINVTEEFDGTLNEALKNLGVVSVELIFDLEGTVMYLVKTEAPVEGIIESLDALSYVNYAEYNQIGEIYSIDPISDVEIIEDEIIIDVTEDFEGTLNETLKNLGVVSVELIFDVEGTMMYLVKTEGPVEGIIDSLTALSYVNFAEYNQVGNMIETVEQPNNTMAYIYVGVAVVVILGSIVVYKVAKKKQA